jgi:hypothetical protein
LRGNRRWKDVPDIEWDYVEGQKVEVGCHVGAHRDMAHVRHVSALLMMRLPGARLAHGGLDLHADKASFEFDDYVVGGGVSPRAGEFEAQLGGFGHETEFGPLPSLFRFLDTTARSFQIVSLKTKRRDPIGLRLFSTLYFQNSILGYSIPPTLLGLYLTQFHQLGMASVDSAY